MRLEPELWEALFEICEREQQDLSSLIRKVEHKICDGGRTSAVRVFVVSYFRTAATEAGHCLVGHGTLPHGLGNESLSSPFPIKWGTA
jgi:predicted DNA-binding ribbon-helix-helix protein